MWFQITAARDSKMVPTLDLLGFRALFFIAK